MKFLSFTVGDMGKVGQVAQASDKVWASPPPGIKLLATYTCQGIAFPGQSPDTLVSVSVIETESNEAMAAVDYPVALAGASLWNVHVLELPVARAAEMEKKMRR